MKTKKCKGTGVAAGYGCGQENTFRKLGLGQECKCYQHWLITTPAGAEIISKSALSGKRKAQTQRNKEKREYHEKNKSISKLKSEARAAFQKWVRMRDANLSCISCGTRAEIWDGGHYYKAELYSRLIFHPVNCNKQCKYCNKYLDGNESGYAIGLRNKYDAKILAKLDALAIEDKQLGAYHWDRDELVKIKELYLRKIKDNDLSDVFYI